MTTIRKTDPSGGASQAAVAAKFRNVTRPMIVNPRRHSREERYLLGFISTVMAAIFWSVVTGWAGWPIRACLIPAAACLLLSAFFAAASFVESWRQER